ncbi:MAG: DUF4870 domain-containing protein [Clostridiales bacterium]|jgi:uncharacterized membrane protein|nr:DUF4870 domain-containing protein [Clostridiales bacterium]
MEDKKNFLGVSDNALSVLSYLFGWVSGLIIFLVEQDNKKVRFHALQSTVWFGGLTVVFFVLRFLGGIPFIGGVFGVISSILGLLATVSWIILMIKAGKGEEFKLPVIGDAVAEQVNK